MRSTRTGELNRLDIGRSRGAAPVPNQALRGRSSRRRWRARYARLQDWFVIIRRTPPLAITPFWALLNAHLISMVDTLSDEALDWRPEPGVWTCRELFVHIAGARHHWLTVVVADGETVEYPKGRESRDEVKRHLFTSWERLERFLSDSSQLEASYRPPADDPAYSDDPTDFNGHFIAYHRLVHDVHHRADILHRMTALGVALPDDHRPRPL